VAVGYLGSVDVLRDVQVALRRGRGADADRFVREAHVQGVAVGLGMYGDGFDAEFTTGPDDPAGDFTTIGDKDFFEHKSVFSFQFSVFSFRAPFPYLAET